MAQKLTHLERLAKSYEVENYLDYILETLLNGNFSEIEGLTKQLKRNELVELTAYAMQTLSPYDFNRLVRYIK